MSSPSPRISVVLPVRNGEHEIESRVIQILEAISDLTRVTSELLVVDDGSKDSTPEVLSELKARYPQVRVVRHSRPRGLEVPDWTGTIPGRSCFHSGNRGHHTDRRHETFTANERRQVGSRHG